MEFSHIDRINIKAISRKGTELSRIMAYWDAVDRSYPTYNEFIESILKLESIGVVEIIEHGRFGIISNRLHKHMSFVERFKYSINKPDDLILKVLNRITNRKDSKGIELSSKDFDNAIKDYYTSFPT